MIAMHSAFTSAVAAPTESRAVLNVRFHLARARVALRAAERFAGVPAVCRNNLADARMHMAAAYAERATTQTDATEFAALLASRAMAARNAGMRAFAERIEALRDSYLIRAGVMAAFEG